MRTAWVIIALIAALGAGLVWAAASGRLSASVRAAVTVSVSQALGRDVSVARLTGDPVRGIVLDGVRVAAQPGERGTFLDVSRITLRFRPLALLVDLLRGRGPAPSLSTIELDRPLLVLSRDATGRWNVPTIPRRRTPGSGLPAFTGTIEVREGTLVFRDAWGRPAPFVAHFERVTGGLSWRDAPRLRLEVDAVHTDGRTPALLHAVGTVVPAEGLVDLEFTTRGASVAAWGPYLAPLGWLRWTGGTVDGDLHLLVSRWGSGSAIDYRGRLRMHDGRAVLRPQRITLSGIEGPLAVANGRVATDGLTMVADTSPVWMRGEISHTSGAYLDLAVRSPSLDLSTLRRTLFPTAALEVTGRAGGEVRVVGELNTLLVEGTVVDAAGQVNGQRFSDLSTRLQYYGGMAVFDGVEAAVGGGWARGYAQIAFPGHEFFVLADLDRVDAAAAHELGLTAVPLRGRVRGFLAAAGAPGFVVGQARFDLERGSIAGMAVDRAEAVAGFDHGAVELDRFEVHSGPAVAHATGVVTPAGRLDLALVATDVNLQRLAGLSGPHPAPPGAALRWLAGTADLTGQVTGTVGAPVLSGRLDARDGRLGPFPFDQAAGRVQISPAGLRTSGLLLRDGTGIYEAAGEVQWGMPERVDAMIRARHVPAQRLLDIAKVPLDMTGTVDATVRLTGTTQEPVADGTLTLLGGRVRGQQVSRAVAAFRWTGAGLWLDDALLEVNNSRIALRGRLDQQGGLAMTVTATGFDLHDVAALRTPLVRVEGTVDLTGSLGGTLAAPTIAATVASSSLRLNEQAVARAEGAVRYQRGRLVFAPLSLFADGGTLQLSGAVLLGEDPLVDLQVSARRARLATLLGLSRVRSRIAVDGTVDGDLAITGRLSNPGAVLTAEVADGIVGDQPIQSAAVNAALANRAVTLRTLSMTPSQGTLIGAGRIDFAGVTELEFSGRGLSLDLLRPLLGVHRPLGGTLDFTLQLNGPVADPVIGVSAAASDGSVGAASFSQAVIQAYYQGGRLFVEQGLLQQNGHKVKVAGTVPLDLARLRIDDTRPVDLQIALVNADVGLLTALTERVEGGQGPLAGGIHVTGTTARPHLEGTLTAAGTIKLRGLAPALTDLQARVDLVDGEIRIETLRARAGDGTLALSGTVGLDRFRPDRVALRLEASGARLTYAPYVDGVADGVLRLDGPVAQPAVSGSLTFGHGDLFVPSMQAGARPSEPAFDPTLDLELASGDEVWVNLGRLRLQVHGTVRASGTLQHPRLSGEVQSEHGTFDAFNTSFSLTEAQAEFAEFRGTTPFVDARAETTMQLVTQPQPEGRVETVRVFLHISGTPDDLVVDLTSDPALTREEILAGLAGRVGITRLLRGGEVESAIQAEVSAAVFGSVSRSVAQAFGLEEFTIVYEAEQPLVLRLGKAVVRHLYVTLTSAFGINPRYIWSLEYRFTPIHMFSFSVDNQGTYDVLYRVTYRF